MIDQALVKKIQAEVKKHEPAIRKFMRDLCRIPSFDSKIGDVVKRINEEMKMLGFDEVFVDKMGNSVGRVGNGPTKIVFDSHVDTVGIADRTQWKWDPFEGKIENDILYALGAVDEKGSTPGMVYGLKILKDLNLLDGYSLYYFGNMEEECDGIAPNSLVDTEKIKPDFVIVGEPTCMRIYRGHRGRVELKVTTKGRTCHASAPERGENAVYKMVPIIKEISEMSHMFKNDAFLGKGSVVVSKIECKTPSLNAVPDECTIYLDRRLTFGETEESAIKELESLPSMRNGKVEELFYDVPSYTGFVFPVSKYYPPWALDPKHPLVQAGVDAYKTVHDGAEPTVDKWVFSTNGTYWMGKANIPSIGFGPGNEVYAHTVNDQVPLAEVVKCTEFYAALPLALKNFLKK
ncbi:MAG TPA: YgeY family selenium metabolism-linked hydrolase [Candidatus Ozemobacteraceae bacterium]|mgnify:CR=1 FL=1|nr:YgeY family selenium metabolism-linked hydrolase [Candidatus Ozemobacteraceae bacterium]